MSEQVQDRPPQEQAYLTNVRESLRERLTWRNTARAVGGAALFAVPTAAITGSLTYQLESRDTAIASFDSSVHLATDGYATFDAAPLSSFRVPTHKPMNLGINVELGESSAPTKAVLYSEAAAIAAQPKGEIDKLSDASRSLLLNVIEGGVAGGLGGVVLYGVIGTRRRQELREKYGSKAARVIIIGVLATACTASSPAPDALEGSHSAKWQNIEDVFPGVPADLADMGVQVDTNVVSAEAFDIIRGMIAGYERAGVDYKEMEQKASELGPELRQPRKGEIVILLMSDRHDNIGMDPINAAIGQAGQAEIVLDAGDEVSGSGSSDGGSWEEFSLSSLVANFKHFKNFFEVTGNHDPDYVGDYLSEADNGPTVLDHESVTVDGVNIMGFADIRSSGFVNPESYATTDLTEYKAQIVTEACEANAEGKRPTIILIHQASLAEDALRAGCADIVLGGHLHQYKGPTEFTGGNGSVGYSFTTDTAGGAAIAIALGPLRRSAGVTLVTLNNSGDEPYLVGIQKVISTQDHNVYALPFEPVAPPSIAPSSQLKHRKIYPNSSILTEERRPQKIGERLSTRPHS